MQNPQAQLQQLSESYPKVVAKEKNRTQIDAAMASLNASITPERRMEGMLLLQEGIKLYQLDKNSEAYDKFEQCKAIYANADAWHHQGVINFQRENFPRAFEEFSAAILMFKDYASAYRFRALCILFILENNRMLNKNSDLENFAKINLNQAVKLGDQEAQRALNEFF